MDISCDVAIIGGGPAGYEAALRARELGLSVVIAERDALGGTCLNRGCVPTKALLRAGELYREMGESSSLGLSAGGRSFDYAAVLARKDAAVAGIRAGLESLVAASGTTVVSGTAAIKGPRRVEIAGADGVTGVDARYLLVATGCEPALPPISGIDHPRCFTSDTLLSYPEFLRSAVIVGGGVIGMEFASFLSDLGCAVTVLEAAPRILPLMDREIGQSLSMILKRRGVSFRTGARVVSVDDGDPVGASGAIVARESSATVRYEVDGVPASAAAEGVLVATGRKADVSSLFADGFCVATERGFIKVDSDFMTSERGVYAAGDVTGGIQLAHAATAQALDAIDAIARDAGVAGASPVRYRAGAIPSCVYTSPEIASVGLTADGAKEAGIECVTGKALALANARSVIQSPERGFVKLVFERGSLRTLGAQMMCERASDIASELSLAVSLGLTARELASSVRAHPTFSEMVTAAARAALRAVN